MTAPAVQAPQISPEQAARIRAAYEELGCQLAEAFQALGELMQQMVRALRPALRGLVRLADYRRERLRVMHREYRRRLRHRRRRAR
ncbi:hypothetical protein ACL02O_29445 [Micromonospora sp. MS34]|uniref:hypothetical protein n=1 Tax=Micromonospora sp. MS34 TaxID=3385971 RepID=UPI0039A3DF7B